MYLLDPMLRLIRRKSAFLLQRRLPLQGVCLVIMPRPEDVPS